MFIRFTLPAIPIVVVAVLLWTLMAAGYIALAPENAAGEENVGILLSTFGLSLLAVDRVAFRIWRAHSWVIW